MRQRYHLLKSRASSFGHIVTLLALVVNDKLLKRLGGILAVADAKRFSLRFTECLKSVQPPNL